jgi:hypothetical protein
MITRVRAHIIMGCLESDDDVDPSVCSGRGECGPNNSCICEIRYTGDNCLDYNKSYHAGESVKHLHKIHWRFKRWHRTIIERWWRSFILLQSTGVSAIFYVVAFISLVQLLICCFAEYKRLKNPSFLKACRITTQKFLYFVVFLATLLRAAYFTQPESVQPSWAYYLMSAYYPLLMTCASLVVCFWAEVR